jgi:hypothetical protein
MRESSPNTISADKALSHGVGIDANSLFQKILPVSPCGSIFWLGFLIPNARKPFAVRILQKSDEKN